MLADLVSDTFGTQRASISSQKQAVHAEMQFSSVPVYGEINILLQTND